jgi:hypothetical protein
LLTIIASCIVAIAAIGFILRVKPEDLPAPEPVSPFEALEERKAAIYENLRDLQFEYRVGKLSDQDYESTKKDLQKELAAVMAEVDRLKAQAGGAVSAPAAPASAAPAIKPQPAGFVCPACGSKFEKELKFCGECGKPMKAVSA